MNKTWIYIAIMALVSYLLRVLPITLIRKEISSTFIKSFLYYLPYVTLSVMIVPSIFFIADNFLIGFIALTLTSILAYKSSNLFLCALSTSAIVFALSLII